MRKHSLEIQRVERVQLETWEKTCSNMLRRNKSRGSFVWNKWVVESLTWKTWKWNGRSERAKEERKRNNSKISKWNTDIGKGSGVEVWGHWEWVQSIILKNFIASKVKGRWSWTNLKEFWNCTITSSRAWIREGE